jgi:hypothetical protein
MPVPTFPNPIRLPLQGQVAADGTLTIRFGPEIQNTWEVSQVSVEMLTAPAGATVVIRAMGALVSPSPSARKASAGGDPPIFLHGGETMTVEWEDCTPGDVGSVLVVYRKAAY